MVIGNGYENEWMPEPEARAIVEEALGRVDLTDKGVLVIIPDSTRTAPVPFFFSLFCELLSDKTRKLDYLVALGTHRLLTESALNQLVGISPAERKGKYNGIGIYNHRWDLADTFKGIGTITAGEVAKITHGLLVEDVPVVINRMIFDYDQLIICGPTYPHEVAGFSGGNKYLFPGISGWEMINQSHWLGALMTNMWINGVKDTPVRRLIDRAASFVDMPILCFSQVLRDDGLAGLYIGTPQQAYDAAADLSARLHIIYVDKPFKRVLSVIPEMYDDLWTGAKGMYKVEPVVADGGEVIIYAPHINEVSFTHGALIDRIGYHTLDYFLEQKERFRDIPPLVMAHCTHLKGAGAFENGVERPRIHVTLATGIPQDRCEQINLNYLDPKSIDASEWGGRESHGIMFVKRAGETLFRLRPGA